MQEREVFGRKENTTLKTNRGRPRSTTSSLPKFGFFLGVPSSTNEQAHEQHNKGLRIKFGKPSLLVLPLLPLPKFLSFSFR